MSVLALILLKLISYFSIKYVLDEAGAIRGRIQAEENVYSLEVEDAIYTHPDVEECVVVGAPDKEWGEKVTAYIIPHAGREIDEKEMKQFLKARLSPYKVPKEIYSVEDFPRSSAGKILKRKLRD